MLSRKHLLTFAVSGFFLLILILTYAFLSSDYRPSSLDRFLPSKSQETQSDSTEWSKFAYVQYATTIPYLCNSVMLFDRLHSLGTKADRLLLYFQDLAPENDDIPGGLLRKARDEYGAILKPVEVQARASNDPTWAESFTKLLAFNQTEYERVLHLDSDSTVLKSLDELFHLPPAIAAMPRSYWEAQEPHIKLSSQLMLATPSTHQFERCKTAIENAKPNEYDMELVNNLYRNNAMVLPYKVYDLYTREFRQGPDHADYLGNDDGAVWNPDDALNRARFLHFSDWPLPKPWIEPSPSLREENMPACFDKHGQPLSGSDVKLCRERELWVGFYQDFKDRRERVCGAGV